MSPLRSAKTVYRESTAGPAQALRGSSLLLKAIVRHDSSLHTSVNSPDTQVHPDGNVAPKPCRAGYHVFQSTDARRDNAMADIMQRLGSDVLVTQGPMGTQLMAQGFEWDLPLPLLNLTEPEVVENLHRLYRAAGADCAITNTFMATSSQLARHGLEGNAVAINVAGVRLAREQEFPHVLASVGPCGIDVEPGSGVASLRGREGDADDARSAGDSPERYGAAVEQYAEQIAALASGDPDAILLETFTSLDDILTAVEAAQKTCDLPILASMSFVDTADGQTQDDALTPAQAAEILQKAGVAAVGCNCMGVDETVAAIEQMRAACDLPLIARPSAGTPETLPDGTPRWPLGPDDFVDISIRLLRAGARVIGTCCGGTPSCTGAIYATVGGVVFPD